MFGFQPTAECSTCRGECCKQMPGAAFPDDFNNDIQLVREALLTRDWVLDYWEGDPTGGSLDRALFVRPAVVGTNRWPVDPSWGGPCVFLTSKGCKLSFESIPPRPENCRALDPSNGCSCAGHSKKESSIAWMKFDLEALAEELDE